MYIKKYSTHKFLCMFNWYVPCLTGFNLHFHTSSEFPAVCSKSFVSLSWKGAEKDCTEICPVLCAQMW